VDDGNGGTDTATVTITITGQNDAPVALGVTGDADEDGPSIVVTSDYSDVDASDTHTFTVDDSATAGSVTNNGNGTFTYAANGAFEYLAVGETATDTFTYTVDDGNGGTDTATVTITITGQNDAPVANTDGSTENADVSHSGNVLDNDTDVDSLDILSVSAFENGDGNAGTIGTPLAGKYGTLTLAADGTWSYAADQTNSDVFSLPLGDTISESFSYTVDDGNGGTDTATLTVTIVGINTTPEAVDDTGSAVEDGLLATGNVLVNDIDPDTGAVLYAELVNAPPAGFSMSPDGAWELRPWFLEYQSLAEGEELVLSIDYTVTDEKGASDVGTLMITVTGTNDGPVAVEDTDTTDEDTSMLIDVLANDTDIDNGSVLNLTGVSTQPGWGSVSIENEQVRFDPSGAFDHLAVGESEQIVIDYTMEDENGASAAGLARVTVTGTNDAPTVADITLNTIVGSGLPQSIVFSVIDRPTLETVDYFVDSDGNGTLDQIHTSDVETFFGPAAANYGLDSADLNDDGLQDIAVAGLYQLVVFQGVGDPDGNGVQDFTPLSLGYDINFQYLDVVLTDLDGDGLEDVVAASSGNFNGLVWHKNLGDQTGDGLADFAGRQILSGMPGNPKYGIDSADIDGDGDNDLVVTSYAYGGTSVFHNQGVNGAGAPLMQQEIIPDVPPGNTAGVTFADIDGDGDQDFVVSNFYPGSNNAVYLNVGNGSDGLADFEILSLSTVDRAWMSAVGDLDGDGDLDIAFTNVANGNYFQIAINEGDGDGDGKPEFSIQSIALPTTPYSRGIDIADLDGDGDNDIVLADYQNRDMIIVTNDGGLDFSVETIDSSYRLWDVVVLGDGSAAIAEDGLAVTAQFAGDDVDSDDDRGSLTYKVLTDPAEGTVINHGDGTFDFDPGSDFQDLALGESRTVTFTYEATDQHGATSGVGTVSIDVAGRNDAPVVTEIAVSADEDGPSVTLSGSFTDVDTSDTHTWVLNTSGTAGSVINNADGTYSYDSNGAFEYLAAGETATDTFQYGVTDSSGATSFATATVTVTGQNDDPVAEDDEIANDGLAGVKLTGASVLVFDNDAIVDTVGGASSESDTIQASLAAKGHSVSTTTALHAEGLAAALVGKSVFVIPEQERGDLGNSLDAAAREVLRDFVENGGSVIVSYDYRNTINEIFGFSLSVTGVLTTTLTSEALGTTFEGGAASLGTPSATGALLKSSLPEGSLSIYDDGTATSVAVMPFGDGQITALGWDWYNAAPLGSYNSGWLDVLDAAVSTADGDPIVTEDDILTISTSELLANDSDIDGDTLSIVSVTTSTNGASIEINGDGTITYDPTGSATIQALNVGEYLVDSFTYSVSDGNGGIQTATVALEVEGRNDDPVAISDTFTVPTSGLTVLDVLANDLDADDPLSIISFDQPSEGSVYVDADTGELYFNPDSDFESLPSGQDAVVEFNYTISDSTGSTSTTNVTLTVEAMPASYDI
uniref:Ig-like domain-containing protein n=1 Tax=Aurantiacibacter hainanensis TaxID=3076114 RepID=UPI0030C6A83F